MVWSEDEAEDAWEDLMTAEPCVYVAADGVYVGTRYKRVLCKSVAASGSLKALKDVEALVGGLQPDSPLRSVSFAGNSPPSVTPYNFFLAGSWPSAALVAALPPAIGHCGSSSPGDAYDYFQERHSAHLVGEAGKLIGQLQVDVEKGLVQSIYAGSMKHAATARRCSLMKRAFVHESKAKFIAGLRADGSDVELAVIKGDVKGTEFGDFGGIVFELFYRVDLDTF
jgi:hypothetical protein